MVSIFQTVLQRKTRILQNIAGSLGGEKFYSENNLLSVIHTEDFKGYEKSWSQEAGFMLTQQLLNLFGF